MILLAQFDPLTLFVLVALGLTIAILMRRAHRYLARQKDDQALVVPPRPKPERATRLMDGPAELARWEVEMHQTARDLSAELNSRISALRAMVAEADRAAARLEEALRKASETGPDPTGAEENAAAGESPPPSAEAFAEAVYTLADYGWAGPDIAARLGRPLPEVERILRARNT